MRSITFTFFTVVNAVLLSLFYTISLWVTVTPWILKRAVVWNPQQSRSEIA